MKERKMYGRAMDGGDVRDRFALFGGWLQGETGRAETDLV